MLAAVRGRVMTVWNHGGMMDRRSERRRAIGGAWVLAALPGVVVLLSTALAATTNIVTDMLPESWHWAQDPVLMLSTFIGLTVLAVVLAIVQQRLLGNEMTTVGRERPAWELRSPTVLRGLTRLLQLLQVLVVLAGIVFGVRLVIAHADSIKEALDFGPFRSERQIIQQVSGPAPWTIEGYGYRYSVEGIRRTLHKGKAFQPRPSLTITGSVTRIQESRFTDMRFQIYDQGGNLLEAVPFEGSGTGNPPLNQRSKLVIVVWDSNPKATSLTIIIDDFYWPAERDLILRDVPIG
jgi:hypothetical protein